MNTAIEQMAEPMPHSSGYTFVLRKCELKRGFLVPNGTNLSLDLKAAIKKFCVSTDPRAQANVFRARRGHYLGIIRNGNKLENFLIVNQTSDGNIKWLLRKKPDLEASIVEIYVVDEVNRAKNATDLPTIGGEAS